MNLERDPRYPTWEDERLALSIRNEELAILLGNLNGDAASKAYAIAEAEGFDEAYCEEAAAQVEDERDAMRTEQKLLRLRIAAIKPLIREEQKAAAENKGPSKKQARFDEGKENQRLHFSYLERIAVALERLCELKSGRNGRQVLRVTPIEEKP